MKANVTAEIIRVTPEIASEWLAEKWGEQRKIRNSHVMRLAADMQSGRFKIGPDAIVRIKGKLANGQHRLQAVVHTNKPQNFLVMQSNDDELYKVIDSGMRRTVADGLIGIPFATLIPSMARWVISYETNTNYAGARCSSEAAGNIRGYHTQIEMIQYCQDNVEILGEAAKFVNPLYEKTKLLSCSIGGAVYVIGHTHNKGDKAKKFLTDVFIEGGPNAAGDLRNRLIGNRGNTARKAQGYFFAITLKAFKAYCNGTRPGVLKWIQGEDLPTF